MTFKRLDKTPRLLWAEADLPAVDFEKPELPRGLCAHPVLRMSRLVLLFELIIGQFIAHQIIKCVSNGTIHQTLVLVFQNPSTFLCYRWRVPSVFLSCVMDSKPAVFYGLHSCKQLCNRSDFYQENYSFPDNSLTSLQILWLFINHSY